jgi:hypothetical protein
MLLLVQPPSGVGTTLHAQTGIVPISIRDDTYQDGSRIYARYGVLEIIYYDLQ